MLGLKCVDTGFVPMEMEESLATTLLTVRRQPAGHYTLHIQTLAVIMSRWLYMIPTQQINTCKLNIECWKNYFIILSVCYLKVLAKKKQSTTTHNTVDDTTDQSYSSIPVYKECYGQPWQGGHINLRHLLWLMWGCLLVCTDRKFKLSVPIFLDKGARKFLNSKV